MREQADAGDVWLNGDKLVFTAAFGAPASDSTLRKEFADYVAAAGLPVGLRLHDREQLGSLIAGQGADERGDDGRAVFIEGHRRQ